jgi:DNA-binding transcriptional ArsR family regulator
MRDGRISPHEVRLLLAIRREPDRWHTNGDLADAAEISERTARAHTARLAQIGVVDVERVFPGNRYRLVKQPTGEATHYLDRVDKAREVFDL